MKKFATYLLLISVAFYYSCNKNDAGTNSPPVEEPVILDSIVILYTNDEHGWMEKTDTHGGAEGMFKLWQTREGYNSADSFLVISGGDMWTGPAISTWFKGESMIEVMNAMEYDATALGNHEFDFTLNTLKDNASLMNYPILAANIEEKLTGEIPEFIEPYIIKTIKGIDVGIIGLASLSTPRSAFPIYVEDFTFTSYANAVSYYAEELIDNEVEIIIVVGHLSKDEMTNLSSTAATYHIPLITGGHTHQVISETSNGVTLVQSGSNLRYYTKIVIEYNRSEETSKIVSVETVSNNTSSSNTEIKNIVDYWKAEANKELSDVIGYCSSYIGSSSAEMQNMVTDSWLAAYPSADVALTNSGGIRQGIEAGEITKGDIIGVLPFTNTIFELELTGEELIDCIGYLIMGGMSITNGYKLSDGTPIEASQTYSVLTTDYLYYQENSKFALYDPTPYNTSMNYHQPTIDWILSKTTSANNPINNFLDYNPRR